MQKVSQHFRPLFTSKFRIASALSICLLTMLLLQVAEASARSIPQDSVYYACANYKTGKIYVIQQNGKCNADYTLIQWNQTGPQGPRGTQGPAGVSQGYYSSGGYVNISFGHFAPFAVTAPVSSGTYIVIATEAAYIDTGDDVGCYVQSVGGSAGHYQGASGPGSEPQYSTITLTDSLSVSAGDQIELLCADYNNDSNTYSNNAAISAIQLNSVGSNVSLKGQGHKPTLPQLHH